MFNKRLISMSPGSIKYMAGSAIGQWASLLAYICAVYAICGALAELANGAWTERGMAVRLAIVCACAVARFFADRLSGRMSFLSGEKIKSAMRERIYAKTLALGASYKERVHTAEVIQLAGEGVEQLEVYFSKYLPQLAYSCAAPLTLFFVLLPVSAPASSAMLACVPVIPLAIIGVSKFAKKTFDRYWGVYTDLGSEFLENVQGLTTLKIYRADGERHSGMNRRAEEFRRVTMKVLVMQLGSITVMDLIAYGGAALGSIIAVVQFRSGAVDAGGCLLILLLSAEYFLPMRLLGSYFHIAMNGLSAAGKIFRLLDTEEHVGGGERIDPSDTRITINGLSFSYDQTPPQPDSAQEPESAYALYDVTLDLPPAGFTALVGESGSGKSTLSAILSGARRGYGGSIKVGGRELSQVSPESITGNITLISAGSHIFKGTVRENLHPARRGACDELLWEALDMVRLSDELKGRGGLDMRISENAANLSGGQKQRLAIARALLRDSPVYIFDEATSNIDAESEQLIVAAARTLARTRSVLMISHRLGNVVGADMIYVLKNGKIQEKGKHSQLLEQEGEYAAMYQEQEDLEKYKPGSNRDMRYKKTVIAAREPQSTRDNPAKTKQEVCHA
ncbi:MAG: ABC transporter ATP-binding protein/permease [Clostridiales Family XIII bacterium]|jgi:ABC-type transport system involved in cytochrome bd biosynthesis fused ATPase/permease subunit|nr:ABC transporter ATP-binding protein/permease [Clostridiales Family XIII bacterium]